MPAAHHYAPPDAAAVQYSSKTVLLAKKEQENQTTEYHTYLHTLPAASTLLHRIRAIPLFVGIYRFYSPDPFFRGILTPASRQDQIPFLGYSFFSIHFQPLYSSKTAFFLHYMCAEYASALHTPHGPLPATIQPIHPESTAIQCCAVPMCRFSCAGKRFPALYVDETEKAAAVRQEAPKHFIPSRGSLPAYQAAGSVGCG